IVAVECGRSHGPLNVGPYITVFYTSTPDGFFVDCVGMIASSNSSDTKSNFVLTSRYCLEPEEDSITTVLPLSYFKYQQYLDGTEIENVWFPDSVSDITSSFNLPPINLAIVKLNQDHYFNSKVSPICLPNQNEKPHKPSLIIEGSPLICIKNNQHYLYGIYSWLKIQKSDYPVVIFTAVSSFTNMTYELMNDSAANNEIPVS
ncbi:hypothetical protein T12_8522, partial [Trichinella patagoniensis]